MEYRILISILVVLEMISCNSNRENAFLVCQCTGETEQLISDERALVVSTREGYKLITITEGIMTTCTDIDAKFQSEVTVVTVSGRYVPTCKHTYSGYGLQAQLFDLTDIEESSEDAYVDGAFTIKVVKSEDYGGKPGFGYELYDSIKNFRVLQLEVPSQPGDDPFTTREEAIKVAYLAAHKLRNFDDFPTIYIGELYFLEIIDGG